MELKYLSVCSGIEAASVAWGKLGWKPIAFSEIADFPSAVLKYHYPDVPNLGDIKNFNDWDSTYKPDVFIGGIPCFVGETLILTKSGLKQIKDITTNDMVWTHKNRWMNVLRTWKTGNKDTIEVHTSMTSAICTGNHPFYTLNGIPKNFTDSIKYNEYFTSDDFDSFNSHMCWTNADELKNKFISFPSLANNTSIIDNDIFQVLLNQAKIEFTNADCLVYKDTVDNFNILNSWINLESDNKDQFSNDNRKYNLYKDMLAIVSHLCGVNINKNKINKIKYINGYSFSKAGIKANKKRDVYNIEVSGDNSYVANGIIVHNCQAYSVAGLRQGLNDTKGRGKPLMLSYLGIINKYRPRYVIFENVPGILTQANGTAFNSLLEGLSMCGYNDISWRIINAEDFNVPQTRNRLFLVACPGSSSRSQRILFKQTWLPGNTRQNEESWKEDTRNAENGSGESSGFKFGAIINPKKESDTYPIDSWEIHNGEPRLKLKKSICMIARWGTGGNNVPIVEETKSYQFNGLKKPDNVITVRKFTPEECEKLQAFPVGYTRIPYNGKSADKCPSARRYQALGNSMCTNVIKWLGERIEMVENGKL